MLKRDRDRQRDRQKDRERVRQRQVKFRRERQKLDKGKTGEVLKRKRATGVRQRPVKYKGDNHNYLERKAEFDKDRQVLWRDIRKTKTSKVQERERDRS